MVDKRTRMAAIAALSWTLIAVANAQQEQPAKGTERALRLGEMVVVGVKAERDLIEEPGLQSRALDIATSTVEEEIIRKQNARSLTDALDFAPGVLTESRGRKVKQFSSFRGQIYPYPDYAINGVWHREFHELPYLFPASQIEKVEVIRSSGALLLGLSDLTGVINVVTKQYDERATFFETEYGRFDTSRTSISHGDRFEKGFYTVGANYFTTAGPDDRNGAERMGSAVATMGFQPFPGLKLDLNVFVLRGDRELIHPEPPGKDISKWNAYEQISPQDAVGVNSRALWKHGDDASTELTVGYVERTEDFKGFVYNKNTSTSSWSHTHSKDYEYSLGVIHARNVSEDNTLRVAFNYDYWLAPEGKRFYVGQRMDIHSFAVALVDEHRFDRLTLDGGVKYMRHYYNDYTAARFDILGAKHVGSSIEEEWADPLLTGTLGATYELSQAIELFSHVALGMVEPPPGAADADGQASIDSETRLMLDAGVKIKRETGAFAKIGGFAVFRDEALVLEDTVDIGGEELSLYSNRNIRQYGLELEARSAKVRDMATLYLNLTAMESLERIDGDFEDHIEVPDYLASAGVYAEWGRFDLNLFGKWVSGYENERFAQDKQYHDLGDYVDLNLTAGWTLGAEKQTRIYCSLENLLGDEYSTVIGYPDHGFQAFIGLQHRR